MQVVLQHLVYTASGFGTTARELAFAMEDMGVDVKIDVIGPTTGKLNADDLQRLKRMEAKPLKNDRILLTLDWNYRDRNRSGYQKAISCVMFETSKAPQAFVHELSGFDAMIVPNEFNRQAFLNGGVRIPVYVAEYGVNSDFYTPQGPRDRMQLPDNHFVFLSIFGWSKRKGPDALIRAFLQEFDASEPVSLLIKTYQARIDDFPMAWYEEVASQVKKRNRPNVKIISRDMSPDQMANLYRGTDCFVLSTRGEGVGLPILESMSTAKPVIATGWSAHTDFLGPSSGYPVSYSLVPAEPLWFTNLYQPDQLWADPDVGSLQTAMRKVYTHRAEAEARGQQARLVAQHWTWKRTAEQFVNAIEEIVGGPIR
jgi:glycosyltransferase involved in cell wall biosynthesis